MQTSRRVCALSIRTTRRPAGNGCRYDSVHQGCFDELTNRYRGIQLQHIPLNAGYALDSSELAFFDALYMFFNLLVSFK